MNDNKMYKEINKDKTNFQERLFDEQVDSNIYDDLDSIGNENDEGFVNEESNSVPVINDKDKKGIKITTIAGIVWFIIMVSTFTYIGNARGGNYEDATQYIDSQMSSSSEIGVLLSYGTDEFKAKDFTIEHNYDSDEYKLYVWDFADEDGDYVQVYVDNVPISEVFMIKQKPREFIVTASGDVQIKGIRDGTGGITYAAYYELNGTTYFNLVPENDINTYNIVNISK